MHTSAAIFSIVTFGQWMGIKHMLCKLPKSLNMEWLTKAWSAFVHGIISTHWDMMTHICRSLITGLLSLIQYHQTYQTRESDFYTGLTFIVLLAIIAIPPLNVPVMTLSNGNIFRITVPLWGESTGHWRIPLTKASYAELWCFLWSAPRQTVKQTFETLVLWNTIALIMPSL